MRRAEVVHDVCIVGDRVAERAEEGVKLLFVPIRGDVDQLEVQMYRGSHLRDPLSVCQVEATPVVPLEGMKSCVPAPGKSVPVLIMLGKSCFGL